MEKSFKPIFTRFDLKVESPYSKKYQEKVLGIEWANRITVFKQVVIKADGKLLKKRLKEDNENWFF